MDRNEVHAPASLEEALGNLALQKVTVCAGGTDLMVKHARSNGLPASVEGPVLLVGHIEDLRRIEVDDDSVVIGAAVKISELGDHSSCPAGLREIIGEFAAPAIRNRGTIVGNICNASPAGDLLPYLYAADATVTLRSTQSERELPVADFITGPGRTDLATDELVISVRLPAESVSTATPESDDVKANGYFYRKVAPRRSNALSKLSVYAEWTVAAGAVKSTKLAIGAAAPTVVRSPEIETRLVGLSPAELRNSSDAIAQAYAPLLVPIDDQRSTATYRKNTALALLRHVLGDVIPEHMESP